MKSAKTFGLQGYEKMKKADLIANLMREDPKEENSNKDDHDKSVHSRDPQPGSNHEPREPREDCVRHHEPRETREGRDDRFEVEGILELADGGFGFLPIQQLSDQRKRYIRGAGTDPALQLERPVAKSKGICRHPNDGDRFGALLYVVIRERRRAGRSDQETGFRVARRRSSRTSGSSSGGRQGPFPAPHRPGGADRQRPARPHRRTAEGR